MCLFLWCVARTVYVDHVDLVQADRRLSTEKTMLTQRGKTLRQEKNTLIIENANLSQENTSLRASIHAGTESRRIGATPTPSFAPSPILVGIRIASQRRVPSDDPKLPYGLEVVIQTDVTIQPVALILVCDGPIGKGHGFEGGGLYVMVSDGIAAGHPNIWIEKRKSPAFTAGSPIVIDLFSETAINAVSVKRIDYTWP